MQDFPSYLLRHYFRCTDWHPSNSYLSLTSHSSSILLDFPIPNGLALSLSSSPTSTFFSTHRLRALPSLTGCAGYVVTRTGSPLIFGGQELREVLERFKIVHIPNRSQQSEAGKRQGSPRDYLLYGCLHAPTARLDALYTTRISPAWNLIITACSFPPQSPFTSNVVSLTSQDQQTSSGSPSSSQQLPAQMSQGPTSPGATNLQFTLQNDAGKWFNEICYSLDDALWGFRTMYHFEPSAPSSNSNATSSRAIASPSEAALDYPASLGLPSPSSNLRPSQHLAEVGGGLRGRFSAGAELFFSAAERSAGLSTGVRFMTLPEGEDDGEGGVYAGIDAEKSTEGQTKEWRPPSQPPTTITATLNPMMGHLSTAYASRMGRDIVACSRYDFNVYSYESDLTVGGEYWLRSSPSVSHSSSSIQDESLSREMKERPVFWTETPSTDSPSDASKALSGTQGTSLRSSAVRRDGQDEVHNFDNPLSSASLRGTSDAEAVTSGPMLQGNGATGQMSTAPISDSTDAKLSTFSEGKGSNSTLPQASTTAKSSSNEALSGDPVLSPSTPLNPSTSTAVSSPSALLKFSLSSSLLLSLLWQGRLQNCLVSVGIKADLAASSLSPRGGSSFGQGKGTTGGVGSVVRTVGMEIVYWGGGGEEGGGRKDIEDRGTAGISNVQGQGGGGGVRIMTSVKPTGRLDLVSDLEGVD